MAKESRKKGTSLGEFQAKTTEQSVADLRSMGLSLPDNKPESTEQTENVPAAEPTVENANVSASEKVEAKLVVPKNSYLSILARLHSYEDYKLVAAFNDPKNPDHDETVRYFNEMGLDLKKDLLPLEPKQVSNILNGWIAGQTDNNSKLIFTEYLKTLEQEGIAELPISSKKDTHKSEREFVLAEEPKFTYGPNYIEGEFKLKNDHYDPRVLHVTIPSLARADLEAQKPNLEKAVAEMMQLNHFKKNPTVVVEGNKLDLKYGNLLGFSVGESWIQEALRDEAQLPKGFTGISLEQYKEAKKFRQEHPNLDFKTTDDEQLRNQSIAADNIIKPFEVFLLRRRRNERDLTQIGNFARDSVFNRLWELKAGDQISALRQKVESARNKVRVATPPEPAAPKPAGEVNPGSGTVESATETGPDEQREYERWNRALPLQDPKYKQNIQNFADEVKNKFGNDWKKILVPNRDASEQDPLFELGKKFGFIKDGSTHVGPEVIRVAAIKVMANEDRREEFEKLRAMSKGEVLEILTKYLPATVLPQASATKADWLRAFLADQLQESTKTTASAPQAEPSATKPSEAAKPAEPFAAAKTMPPRPAEQQTPPRAEGPTVETDKNPEESESKPVEATEAENEELETEQEKTPLETITEILEKRTLLTEEILTAETELEGEALDAFLVEYLAEIGYLDDYRLGLQEYEVESTTEYLVNAVNGYRKLYEKRLDWEALHGKRAKVKAEKETITEGGSEEESESGEEEDEEVEDQEQTTEPNQENPKNTEFEQFDGVPIPEGLEIIVTFKTDHGRAVLLLHNLTKSYFIGIIKNRKLETAALPEDLDLQDQVALVTAAKAMESLSEELKSNYVPVVKVTGALDEPPAFSMGLELSLGGTILKINDKEFTDKSRLTPETQKKNEHNGLFKYLLLERMSKFGKISEKDLTEEDKKQIKMTSETIARLAAAPQQGKLSFAEAVTREALKIHIEKLKTKTQEKKTN